MSLYRKKVAALWDGSIIKGHLPRTNIVMYVEVSREMDFLLLNMLNDPFD